MAGDERVVTVRLAAEDAYSGVMKEFTQAFALLPKQVLESLQKVETAFRGLDIKSELNIDVEKAKIVAAFEAIKNSGTASANDIRQAEEAMQRKLAELSASGGAVDSLQKAFQTLNIKSNLDIEAEKAKIITAFEAIKNSGTASANEIKRAEDSMKAKLEEISGAPVDKFKQAFQSLNIKSQFDIEAEKKRMVAAFETIKNSGVASADEIKRAQAAMHTRLDEIDGKTKSLGSGFFEMGKMIAAAFSVREIAAFVKSSYEANMAMESINSKLQVVASSSQTMAQEWEFVRQLSRKLGLDVQMAADAYASFMIAAKGTSAEGEPARKLFVGLSEAITTMHLPTEKATSIMTQFQQMLAKGKVNQQDMKVAAESGIPVYQMLADALGVSAKRIMEMMEAGTIMTAQVAGPMADSLHKTYGAAAEDASKKGRAALNNFNTTVFETKVSLGDALAPAIRFVMTGVEKLVFAFKNLVSYVEIMGIGLGAAFDKAAVYIKAFFNGDLFTDAGQARVKKSIAAIDSAAGEAFKDLEMKYGIYSDGISKANLKGVNEDTINHQRRRDEAKKTGEDLAKINLDYAKAQNDIETISTANYQKAYEERKKATIDYYNQKKAYAKDDGEELAWEKIKTAALLQIDKQHAEDSKLVAIDKKEFAVKISKEQAETEVREIQEKIKKHELAETDGALKILAVQKQSALDTLAVAREKEEEYARIYGTNSEVYKKLLKDRENAEQAALKISGEDLKAHEAQKKYNWEVSLASYKNILDKELLYIQESSDQGTLSVKEAAKLRLTAETDYLEKVANERRKQLAALNPETQAAEYQKMLGLKIEADKQYEAALQKVKMENDREITERHKEEIEKRKAADQAALEQQRAFASSWFALWDKAYNDGAASLSKLSDAAYNAFAAANKLPLKISESIESLKQTAAATEAELNDMGKAADMAALTSANGFGRAYHDLQMITAGAKEVTLEFINQKIAALTLSDGLAALKGATPEVIRAATESIANFKLLDNSTLDKLKGQIERLKGIVESFRDAIRSTVSSLQDELDNLTLSKAALETKRYEKQVADLNDKIKQAVALNDAEAQEQLRQAIENAKKIHDIKMKNIADEAAAAAAAANASKTTTNPTDKTKLQGFARGGQLPGDSAFDSIQVMARPGEWFINNEASKFWGNGIMSALNEPWTTAGQAIAERLRSTPRLSIASYVPPTPKQSFATGGQVVAQKTSVEEVIIEKQTVHLAFVSPEGTTAGGRFTKGDAEAMLDILREAGLRSV